MTSADRSYAAVLGVAITPYALLLASTCGLWSDASGVVAADGLSALSSGLVLAAIAATALLLADASSTGGLARIMASALLCAGGWTFAVRRAWRAVARPLTTTVG